MAFEITLDMQYNFKFSILIPAYKRRFFKECLDSIFKQTYTDFEIIIVDDNSPEDLWSIVKDYKDNRLQYFRNKIGFGGHDVVRNWNKCLDYASGDYVVCIGDDDMLLPQCLNEYHELIQRYPGLNIYHARTLYINENSEIYDLKEARPERESVYSMMWHQWRGRMQFVGDCLFRTSYLKSIGGYYYMPYAWTSDHITAYLAAESGGIANMQVPGFLYRVNSLSITKNTSNTCYKIKAINLASEWYEKFLNRKPKNEIDILYWKSLLFRRKPFVNESIACCLSEEICNRKSALLFYLFRFKEYQLNRRIITKTIVNILKTKLR